MNQQKINDNLIVKLTFKFSLDLITYCELLQEERKFIIANQLIRSGTSIGANIREAQNAESKNDFIHKFKIAAKETNETEYWLALCHASENYPDCTHLISQLEPIAKIITKIITSSKKP